MSHPSSPSRLLERDAGLLWHPYAPLAERRSGTGQVQETVRSAALRAVTDARGAQIKLEDDAGGQRWVVDGMASWWSAIHGYRHPVLDAAAKEQIDRFSHVMFGGLTHEPAIGLAERLVGLSPAHEHVFLADSGSVSVEVALKLAVQYQAAKGRGGRQRILALEGGYHGDTTGAMAVSDPVGGMHSHFAGLLPQHLFLPRPPVRAASEEEIQAWCEQAKDTASRYRDELAGVITEPLVQGAGGMHFYAPQCLRALRDIADELDLVFIADEIATGFYRTGELFACESAGVSPDVRCVGKALTGGYMSLAAVLVKRETAAVISDSDLGALMHGPTFMGNPLACSVAAASLDVLDPVQTPSALARLNKHITHALEPCLRLEKVREVRTLGGIGVVQLSQQAKVREIGESAIGHGAWVRPFRDLVYIMPPYVTSEQEMKTLGSAIFRAIEEVHP